MYVPSKNQAVCIKGNNRREIMVRTRQQRASDESSGETALGGTDNQSSQGDTAGPSCSSLAKQSARKPQTRNPPKSAVPLNNKGSTKEGKIRQRLKWTEEMNQYIMRCYYKLTQMRTDETAYRSKLHEIFKQKYTTMEVTVQRVADQRRAIEKGKYVPESVLRRIKNEVQVELV